MTGGRAADRPRTPDYLKKFVHDLYGEHCLWCRIPRPLAVAHLDPWPVVRSRILTARKDVGQYGFWTFHQPDNVVLLCCNCHALLDDPKVTDITQEFVLERRNQKLGDLDFVVKVRNFVVREYGSTPRRQTNPSTLAPLEEWLRDAALACVLPPPHRFYARWGDLRMLIDLVEMAIGFDEDEQLPTWNGQQFLDG